MKKKFLALTLCIVTALSIVGCAASNNTNTNETTSTISTNENDKEYLSYFPEKLEIDNNKLININDKVSMGGDSMNFIITTGFNEENTYMSFIIEDAFDYKTLIQGPNSYSYLDMYSALKEALTEEDIKDMKEDYANDLGVDASLITDEEFDNVFRKQTLLYGYTDLSLDGVKSDSDMTINKEAIDSIQAAYVDQGKVNSLLSSYNKESLTYVETKDGVVKACYEVSGFAAPVFVGVNEATKEVVYLGFCYEIDGMTYDIEMTFSEFNVENIATEWAKKDVENTSEEVAESMMMTLMMITMGQIQ